MDRIFYASLIAPCGYRESYCVEAKNKTAARAQIAAIYRRNTPAKKYGFYSFAQQKLVWEGEG